MMPVTLAMGMKHTSRGTMASYLAKDCVQEILSLWETYWPLVGQHDAKCPVFKIAGFHLIQHNKKYDAQNVSAD